MSKSAYHLYESDGPGAFKQRYLPMDLARRIAAVLQDHGVNPDEVLALAGVGVDEASLPALSAGEERLLDDFREMEPEQRQLLLQLANQMRSHRPGDTSQPRQASANVTSDRKKLRSKAEAQA